MNIEFKIDYLQVSTPYVPEELQADDIQSIRQSGMPFYDSMVHYACGAYRHDGHITSKKHLLVMSGSVCDRLKIDGRWLQDNLVPTASVSRLDLAMTTDEDILTKFVEGYDSIESKLWTTMKIIADEKYTPETVIVGDMKKRAKKGMVRAYDKALQLNLSDLKLHRIEIELRRKHAQISSQRLAHGASIPSVMNSKFRINEQWYTDIFGRDESTARFPQANESDIPEIEQKLLWLRKQVLPTLQYVIDYDKKHKSTHFATLLDGLTF